MPQLRMAQRSGDGNGIDSRFAKLLGGDEKKNGSGGANLSHKEQIELQKK